MTTRRLWPVLVLAYVVFDLSAPSLPGVVSFEADELFIDGAVTPTKSAVPRPAPAHAPQLPDDGADDLDRAVSCGASRRPIVLRQLRWHGERRDASHAGGFPSRSSSASDDH